MIDETKENIEEQQSQDSDELTLLKERADLMGITYHPSIGVEKLKAKIEAKKAGPDVTAAQAQEELDTISEATQLQIDARVPAKAVPTPRQQAAIRREKALRLVRARVTCMNPIKGNMSGDIFQAGNSELGVIKKYVPFNAEQGWHIPQIILNMIQKKKFMTFYETKIGTKKIKRQRLVPEYAIEILPPLTPQELQALKQRQLMAQGQ